MSVKFSIYLNYNGSVPIFSRGYVNELASRTVRPMTGMAKKEITPILWRTLISSWVVLALLHTSSAFAKERHLVRPDVKSGLTIVSVGIWVVDIDSIDSAQQNFVSSVFVSLRWKDKSLAHGGKKPRMHKLDRIWNPGVQIANEIGIVRKTMPEIAEVSSDGTVTYRQRYVGPFSQPLRLQDFPFDRHVFRFHLVATGYRSAKVQFIPDATYISAGMKYAAGIAKEISLPDWRIIDYETKELPYETAPGITNAGYALEFLAERHSLYYVWKIILPLVLIVLMSWSLFLIPPKNVSTKIAVATSAMLTLIAYRFVVDSQVPRVPYLTRLDIFIFADTLLVLSSLFMVTLTAYLLNVDKERLAIRIEQVWRLLFLGVFGIILLKTLFF
jgi:hypothetical protein